MKKRLDWKIGIWGSAVILTLFASLLLARMLPESIAWENGSIENTQIVVLLAGTGMSCFYGYKCGEFKGRIFWSVIGLFFLFAVARELSWGRVFFPTGTGATGPVFLRINDLYNKTVFHAVVGVSLFMALAVFFYAMPWKKIFQIKLPMGMFFLCFLSFIFYKIGEDDLFFSYTYPEGQIIEEIAELIIYLLSLVLIRYYAKELDKTEPV